MGEREPVEIPVKTHPTLDEVLDEFARGKRHLVFQAAEVT